jgi:hypothetical protein
VDSETIFEFLDLAANNCSTREAQVDAYWMVVYIFLKKVCNIDIANSFSSPKVIKMLKKINLLEYHFRDGALVFKPLMASEGKQIDLAKFSVAQQIVSADKMQEFLLTNNQHNLCKVVR